MKHIVQKQKLNNDETIFIIDYNVVSYSIDGEESAGVIQFII